MSAFVNTRANVNRIDAREKTRQHESVLPLVYLCACNTNFPPYPLCKFTRVCYRESFDFASIPSLVFPTFLPFDFPPPFILQSLSF